MRRSDLAALVVVPLAVVLAAFAAPGPPARSGPPAPHTEPVEHATLSCPPLPSPGNAAAGRVSAAVVSAPVPSAPAASAAGSSAQPAPPVRVSVGGDLLARLDRRGTVWSSRTPDVARGLRADAEGALAAGLSGAVAAVLDGSVRGLAGAPCHPPRSHWWFVGAATTAARSGVLHLANPTAGVAVADLSFYGPRGQVRAAGPTAFALAPGERATVPLADLVPGARTLTVEVVVRQGRLHAALTEVTRDGLDTAGVGLVPPAAPPARTRALTGIPAAGGAEHTLAVVNTGDRATVVGVEVLGDRGAFTATALESLRVPADAAVQARLPAGVVEADAVGLRLTADQPVTASVRSGARRTRSDHSYAVAARPVRLAATPVLPGLRADLVLTAPAATAGTAEVRRLGPEGGVRSRETVALRGGQTTTVPVSARRTASVTVRVSGPGRILAAVQWRRDDPSGTLRTGFPLPRSSVTVRRPAVRYRVAPPG